DVKTTILGRNSALFGRAGLQPRRPSLHRSGALAPEARPLMSQPKTSARSTALFGRAGLQPRRPSPHRSGALAPEARPLMYSSTINSALFLEGRGFSPAVR